MTFQVTPIYALPLALILLILWFRTTSMRAELKLSIGDGGNPDMLLRIRQHGNFVEWAPFVLILMILAEGMGAPALYLHISGALLLIGRIAHLQQMLYAEHGRKVLLVLQGMDTSGKDGTVRAMFSQINPMGVRAAAFKSPTDTELAHDYGWGSVYRFSEALRKHRRPIYEQAREIVTNDNFGCWW